MIQLSSPTVVTACSLWVPVLKVQNSRTVLRSPITSSVTSPRWFWSCQMSCEGAPIELNWKKRLSRPIVVRPSITQCGPITVPAPMRTWGPMTEYGPTSTLLSSSAAGSMTAVGWIFAICPAPCSGDLAHRAHQLGLGGELAVHAGLGRVLVDACLGTQDLGFDDELVTRLDRALETGTVDAGEVHHRVLARVGLHRGEGQQRRGLGHRLEDQHARHHRAVREVAHEEGLVHRHVLQGDDALVLVQLGDAVHQQEGVAVREPLEDLVDVHHGSAHGVIFFSSARSRLRKVCN